MDQEKKIITEEINLPPMQDNSNVPGNQFWKLKSKAGRERLFASPLLMQQAADEYFIWCNENPLYEEDYRGKDATKVKIAKMRSFTYEGLTNYFGCNVQYLNDIERGIRAKDPEKITLADKQYSTVIAYIRNTIRQQKFEGAAAGQLNANIIARDLGLTDRSLIGSDPDNPLQMIQQVVVFQLPDNNRNIPTIEI